MTTTERIMEEFGNSPMIITLKGAMGFEVHQYDLMMKLFEDVLSQALATQRREIAEEIESIRDDKPSQSALHALGYDQALDAAKAKVLGGGKV